MFLTRPRQNQLFLYSTVLNGVEPISFDGGLEEPCQSRVERSRWTLVLDIGRLKRAERMGTDMGLSAVLFRVVICLHVDDSIKQLLFQEEIRQPLPSHGHISDITTPTRNTDC
jgi:hypothetical protein